MSLVFHQKKEKEEEKKKQKQPNTLIKPFLCNRIWTAQQSVLSCLVHTQLQLWHKSAPVSFPYQSCLIETTRNQLRTTLEVVSGGQDGEPGWLSWTAGLFNSKILLLAASRGLHYAHQGLRFGEWQPTTNHASPTQEQEQSNWLLLVAAESKQTRYQP